MSDLHLIAGLGNPGLRYRKTRHNLGFMVIDAINKSLSGSLKKREHQAETTETTLAGQPVLLVKPLTYMNRSGEAIGDIAAQYRVPTDRMLIIYDDVALPFGQLRIRGKGSSGGHNGLESIINELDTDNFSRLRLGIGSDNAKEDMIKFVLSKFDRQEKKLIDEFLNNAINAINSYITNGLEKTMNEFNTRQKAKPNQEVST